MTFDNARLARAKLPCLPRPGGATDDAAATSRSCFDIVPGRILRLHVLAAVVLAMVSAGFEISLTYFGPDRYPHLTSTAARFVLDSEGNVPTWFSAVGLLAAAMLLGVVARAKWAQRDRFALRWALLAAVFGVLSLDEVASLHELLSGPVRRLTGADGFLYFSWVIPAAGFVVVLALFNVQFLLHLPWRTMALFAAAAVVFLSGALGMEMIGSALGGADVLSADFAHIYRAGPASYLVVATAEELLEMLGVAVFIYALLDYMQRAGIRPAVVGPAQQRSLAVAG